MEPTPPNHLLNTGYMPQSPVDLKPDASLLLTTLSNPQSVPSSSTYSVSEAMYAGSGGVVSSQSTTSPDVTNLVGVHRVNSVNSVNSMNHMNNMNNSGNPSPPNNNYPPNHPLSGSKHFCSICGDRASGKHYGVYSCEGCKGFFKRTVRKELTYACRENRDCVIDKRQRNRCQYCRYMKCLDTGMKREAVQEERHRGSNGPHHNNNNNNVNNNNTTARSSEEVESSTSGGGGDMPIERIIEAEDVGEMKQDNSEFLLMDNNSMSSGGGGGDIELQRFGLAKKRIIHQLIEWAKLVPHFSELKVEDQVTLIRGGWNELLVAGLAFRSMKLNDGILLGNGTVVTRENAHEAGVGHIFDRVLVELIAKMKEMQMDKAELGCLRAIILFNPDAKGLSDVTKVENLREKVYATLEEYTRSVHENEPSRFAKLLLRLPALRSIGLKCLEHLFFYKLVGDYLNDGNPLEKFIQSLLEECC